MFAAPPPQGCRGRSTPSRNRQRSVATARKRIGSLSKCRRVAHVSWPAATASIDHTGDHALGQAERNHPSPMRVRVDDRVRSHSCAAGSRAGRRRETVAGAPHEGPSILDLRQRHAARGRRGRRWRRPSCQDHVVGMCRLFHHLSTPRVRRRAHPPPRQHRGRCAGRPSGCAPRCNDHETDERQHERPPRRDSHRSARPVMRVSSVRVGETEAACSRAPRAPPSRARRHRSHGRSRAMQSAVHEQMRVGRVQRQAPAP